MTTYLQLSDKLRIIVDAIVAYDYVLHEATPDTIATFDEVKPKKNLTVYMQGGHKFQTNDAIYIDKFLAYF